MEHNAAFSNLPNEALSHVLLHLSLQDLISCSTLNKLLNELTNQNFIWRNLFINDHNGTIISHEGSWKELYKQDAPLLNLKSGRFFYRCRAKVVKMPNVNGDLERLYEFNSEIGGVMNKTVNYRGSYSPSTTLSSEFVDLNTFEHFKIKGPSDKHIKLVGKYWLLFNMETQTAPYQSGISFRDIHVYRLKPDAEDSNLPSKRIPSKTVATLHMEWEPKTQIWGEFSGTCFAHFRKKRTQDYRSYESTFIQFYDFAQTSQVLHEVTVPGEFLHFSNKKLAYFTDKLTHTFKLYDWRAKGDLETNSITFSVPNERQIHGLGFTNNQIVTYDDSGHLTLYDDATGKVLKQYNIEQQTKLKGGYLQVVDNVCCLRQKMENNKTAGFVVIDLRTGQIIQTLNFGTSYCRMEPLGAANGKFNGKFLVTCEGDVAILDAANPHIHEHCTVMSIPCADSIDVAQLGVKFHRVSSARLWSQLAGLCECPSFNLDSQVLKEVNLNNKKYRYVVVFNSVVNESQTESKLLKQFFAACPFQHADSAPLQGVSLDLHTTHLARQDYGYGNRANRFKSTSDPWPASLLKGYGTAVLVMEIWSTKHGWIPCNLPDNFSLQTLL